MERTPQAVAPRSAGAIILRDKPNGSGVARESPERGVRGEKLEVFSPVGDTAYQKKYDLCTEHFAVCTSYQNKPDKPDMPDRIICGV